MSGGLAVRGLSRRALVVVHRWTGVFLLLFVTAAAVTGAALVVRDDLDAWLTPTLMVVPPGRQAIALDEVITRVEARFTDASVSSITLPERASGSLSVYLQAKQSPATGHTHGATTGGVALEASQAFVDPATGAILGQRNTRRLGFNRASFVPALLQLHHSLLLGSTGKTFMGGVAIIWCLTSLVGLALAWPRAAATWLAWLPMLSVGRGRGAYRFNYDVHRATSVLLLPVLLVLAFTSVYLNLPATVRPAVAAVSTLRPDPRPLRPATCVSPVSVDAALRAAIAAVPGSTPYLIAREFGRGWYRVRLRTPQDIGTFGDSAAYIDACTGQVAELRLVSASKAGEVFMNWLYPLHTGAAFGSAGRVLVGLTGIALAVGNVSAAIVWWLGWRQRRASRRARGWRTSIA